MYHFLDKLRFIPMNIKFIFKKQQVFQLPPCKK
jgi:hypothetical protein